MENEDEDECSEHRAVSGRCMMCGSDQEPQSHMLLDCTAYDQERRVMIEEISQHVAEEWHEMRHRNREDIGIWLLSNMKCDLFVRKFLDTAFTKRKILYD